MIQNSNDPKDDNIEYKRTQSLWKIVLHQSPIKEKNKVNQNHELLNLNLKDSKELKSQISGN